MVMEYSQTCCSNYTAGFFGIPKDRLEPFFLGPQLKPEMWEVKQYKSFICQMLHQLLKDLIGI